MALLPELPKEASRARHIHFQKAKHVVLVVAEPADVNRGQAGFRIVNDLVVDRFHLSSAWSGQAPAYQYLRNWPVRSRFPLRSLGRYSIHFMSSLSTSAMFFRFRTSFGV